MCLSLWLTQLWALKNDTNEIREKHSSEQTTQVLKNGLLLSWDLHHDDDDDDGDDNDEDDGDDDDDD